MPVMEENWKMHFSGKMLNNKLSFVYSLTGAGCSSEMDPPSFLFNLSNSVCRPLSDGAGRFACSINGTVFSTYLGGSCDTGLVLLEVRSIRIRRSFKLPVLFGTVVIFFG